ncbi:MAG TPA: serine/threonine-protein kinase, partial [Candidatus Acidoferrales bacterium]|nr:serine/threonine-protein kinase [Candidatus Acidoferrales bacterium]
MKCSYCLAVNPDGAQSCAACGHSFVPARDDETIASQDSHKGTSRQSISTPANDPAPTVAGSRLRVDPVRNLAAQRTVTDAAVITPPPTPTSSGSVPPSGPDFSSGGGISFTLEPGADFGPRYRIESRLGEGGMGVVYKAYDKELDRTVAIKLLRVGVAAEPGAMARFKQELLLASKVSHKNIMRIHDLGDVGGIKFISMAFIEGEDLHADLKREGKLPVERLVKIARQLLAALDAAHAEGVVHRDLKPQNVLLDKNDNVYISDFGLAKSVEATAAGMTRSGEFLGTPKYMSPEQVEAQPVDHRSDLYSLGLILYEMATGQAPFTGDSTLQVMYQRVKQKPKNVKAVNPELPDYLTRVIMRCLEK